MGFKTHKKTNGQIVIETMIYIPILLISFYGLWVLSLRLLEKNIEARKLFLEKRTQAYTKS